MDSNKIAFGPVNSRRLGKSINILNSPDSVCTYSCVYCHGGHTQQMTYERTDFHNPMDIVKAVRLCLAKAQEIRDTYDYIAFIPDGEPTQDINLGKTIDLLKKFGIKIGVMTNTSLIWRDDVCEELAKADWVSLKLDTLDEDLWRRTNRPHKDSRFATIIEGIIEFAQSYKGTLVTETMLIKDHNIKDEHALKLGAFLKDIKPSRAYISVPINPPTMDWVLPPPEKDVNRFYQLVYEKFPKLEHLLGYNPDGVSFKGDIRKYLLAQTAIHPLNRTKINNFLQRAESGWSVVQKMIDDGEIVECRFNDVKYYMRKIIDNRKKIKK